MSDLDDFRAKALARQAEAEAPFSIKAIPGREWRCGQGEIPSPCLERRACTSPGGMS
jgi:hypothetical protein